MVGLILGLAVAVACAAGAWPRGFDAQLESLEFELRSVVAGEGSPRQRAVEVDELLADFERSLRRGEEVPRIVARLAWLAGAAVAIGLGLYGWRLDAAAAFCASGLGAVVARRAARLRGRQVEAARRDADAVVSEHASELRKVEGAIPVLGRRRPSRRRRG